MRLNVMRQIEAGQVGSFEGTQKRHAQSEAGFDHFIDPFGRRYPLLHQRHGFSPQSVLHSISQEAGHIPQDLCRSFAYTFHQLVHGFKDLLRRKLRSDDFHTWNNMRRIPEVSAYESIFPFQRFRNESYADCGRVGAQNCLRIHICFQLCE